MAMVGVFNGARSTTTQQTTQGMSLGGGGGIYLLRCKVK